MRRPLQAGLVLVAGLVAVLALGSCGGSLLGTAKTAAEVTRQAVDAAGSAWTELDRAEQLAIVDAAASFEAGDAELRAWRERRRPVEQAFATVRAAHAALVAAIGLVEQAQASSTDLLGYLAEVLRVYGPLCDALRSFGVEIPALPWSLPSGTSPPAPPPASQPAPPASHPVVTAPSPATQPLSGGGR